MDTTMSWRLILALTLLMALKASAANIGCQGVSAAFRARGIEAAATAAGAAATPHKAGPGQMCPVQSGDPSCCTLDMEKSLASWSDEKYNMAVRSRAQEMAGTFRKKAAMVEDHVQQILATSQESLHNVFSKTYGNFYQKHDDIFRHLYKDLRAYATGGGGGGGGRPGRKGRQGGPADGQRAMRHFFTTLYKQMFALMNAQYQFDATYLQCVGQHFGQHRPFGDAPAKMGASVQRALGAQRALVLALRAGQAVAKEMQAADPSEQCLHAVQKMNSCPTCLGMPEVKPCRNYCLNVVKGCLAFHLEMQEQWDKYIDALIGLSDRLSGPLNVESVILPLDLKISDAIMKLQETSFRLTRRVFETCGSPRINKRQSGDEHGLGLANETVAEIGNDQSENEKAEVGRGSAEETAAGMDKGQSESEKAKADSGLAEETETREGRAARIDTAFESALKATTTADATGFRPKTDFEKVILDLRRMIRGTQGFWRHLPYQMCLSDDDDESANSASCWNGTSAAPYLPPVADDGLAQQLQNPEVPVSLGSSPSVLTEQAFRLKQLTLHLKSAARGEDLDWWLTAEAAGGGGLRSLRQGDGGGSGDAEYYDEGSGGDYYYYDDEDENEGSGRGHTITRWGDGDEEEEEEGSGRYDAAAVDADDEEEEDWEHWLSEDVPGLGRPEVTTTTSTTTTTEATVDVVDRDSGSARVGAGFVVTRAVLVYLLPGLACWLGRLMQV